MRQVLGIKDELENLPPSQREALLPSPIAYKAMLKVCPKNEREYRYLIELAEEIKNGNVNSSAMNQVIKHLLIQPHTCASLVKKIGVYSSSHISHCLRRLKNAGLIESVWDFKQVCMVYYNLKLGKDEQSHD